MKTRYLVHYHESHVSAPVTGDGGRHIAYTKFMPDRGGQYCAELTRAEWDELRRVRWSSPLMECHGCLVPDVDFVATDGKVFTDEQACIAHETALTMAALDAEAELQLSQQQCGQMVSRLAHNQKIAGSIPATATISTGDEMPPSLESRLITALASGKVHINTLVKDLGANREAIKEAVQASDFLVMDRACVALRKF